MRQLFVFPIILLLLLSCEKSTNECMPFQLLCEYLLNPIGMDSPNPRLKWKLDDQRPGAVQYSYEIITGSDSLDVANGVGDMWNSGQIVDDSMLATYRSSEQQRITVS